MTNEEARQVAYLLNTRNQLVRKHTVKTVLEKKDNYVFLTESQNIIACAESKKVQWYQWEICHVSVAISEEGRGIGGKILKLAEERATKGGAKILQCTIRSDNEKSIRLFLNHGYNQVSSFYNNLSGNWVYVFQKSVST
jgi:L-amino acid N-acyltransferase YncA